MISLEILQVIDSIERKGSFAAAAAELYRVPSALTYLIKKTEEQLNIKLFDRNGQRATLTPTGRLLLERGRDILQQVRRLEDQAKEIDSGNESQLRVVVDAILPITPFWQLFKELQNESPWLNIQIMEEALSGSWEALVQDRADLIIGVTGDEPVGGYWHKQGIGALKTLLCCSPHHPAAQLPQPLDHKHLSNVVHVLASDSTRNLTPRNIDMLGLQQTLAVANMTQKLDALINGMGISHLPEYLAKPAIQKGLLVQLKTITEPLPQTLFMAWPKDGTGKLNERLRNRVTEPGFIEQILQPLDENQTI